MPWLFRCITKNYFISKLVHTLRLVNLAGCTLLHRLLKFKVFLVAKLLLALTFAEIPCFYKYLKVNVWKFFEWPYWSIPLDINKIYLFCHVTITDVLLITCFKCFTELDGIYESESWQFHHNWQPRVYQYKLTISSR